MPTYYLQICIDQKTLFLSQETKEIIKLKVKKFN
jgi:hypothetical protein